MEEATGGSVDPEAAGTSDVLMTDADSPDASNDMSGNSSDGSEELVCSIILFSAASHLHCTEYSVHASL